MKTSVVNRVAVGDILRRSAARFGGKTALTDGGQNISYFQLDRMANQFGNYLLKSGYQKGDAIATICGNSSDFVVAMFGIAKAGLVWVPVNPGVSLREKNYILKETQAKMLIGDADLISSDLTEFKELCERVLVIGELDSEQTFVDVFSDEDENEPEVEIEDRDTAQIMFTSGTTGNPKGVLISHLAVYVSSMSNIIEMGLKSSDTATAMMPMFHCAQHTFTVSFLNIGATSVIIRKFEPASLMKTIQDHKITWTFGLPIMYKAILHHPERKQYDLSSLATCMYAMAPMDKTTLERCINELGADFSLGTGQTEVYPATMLFKPEEQLRRFGSYWGGSALINDTAVMDEEGNLLPSGQIGEIVHRGPNVMTGYLNNEEETRNSRKHNWHHTGDLGYWDEDGQMVFVDRKKDLIKTGGENVASIKVEQVLLTHEKIANAVAVGLPHEKWNEAVTAFVVPKTGETLSEDEIIQFCKERLGSFQVPKAAVITEELPMTTTGKIQKHILRQTNKDLYLNKQR
ncbi:class I adenylate-forming enzyme family protein [Alteribacter natronophilus]|uniref:class I adenylate-forming enzyme family protein n=1 Tax=Alteribacter natronophilus TaxID=2583810 RepID=UPI00110E69E6|nr:AMP-binding protein [Alteribacter natronophilus]TMW71576.1 AMP-binding protein [Alteribacter natronophilus]